MRPLAAAAVLLLTALSPISAQQTAKPRLVVLLTVDQMRSDYYDRFKDHLRAGFPRLYERGAVFNEAYQDHGFTETAPGHASLLSGRFPVHTGIATNAQGVNTPTVSVLGGGVSDQGASPFRFQGTTLIDWMRKADPATKFLSVSRKDRGAILPIGSTKGDVYWFASTGQFATSTYYRDTLPTWVRHFNDRHLAWSHAGDVWSPMYGASVYPEADSVPVENGGRDFTFNHVMPKDPAATDTAIINFPWMDELTLQLALAGVKEIGLGGAPNRTDVLAVSLSTTDAIGHRYGPDSKELHDQIIQLDRFLGAFFDSLYVLRDSMTILVALSADHGMTPFPSIKSKNYPNAGAQRVDLAPVWAQTKERLARAGVDSLATFADNILTLNTASLKARYIKADSIADAFAADVMQVQGVLRADLVSRLPAADTVHDAIARRWLHVFSPKSDTTRLVVTLTPFSYAASNNVTASHGSPHDADAHVPLVLYGPGIRMGRRSDFVRTVDLAPTLAAILGIMPTEVLDGRPLSSVIAGP